MDSASGCGPVFRWGAGLRRVGLTQAHGAGQPLQSHWANFAQPDHRLGGNPFHPDGLDGKGYYHLPTIFTEATNEMRIARDEIFGRVLTVIPFGSEQEAIRLANDTDYGLAFGIHTLNLKRAHRVARALRAGRVWVNTYNMFDATTPFGGYKSSGVGREGGPEVMEHYTQYKSVWIDLS